MAAATPNMSRAPARKRRACGAERLSLAKARSRSGDDLHGYADDPSGHDHGRPGDVRVLTKDDYAGRRHCRERREERAQPTQEFRGVDLGTGAAVRSLAVAGM